MKLLISTLILVTGAWARGFLDHCYGVWFPHVDFAGTERMHLEAKCGPDRRLVRLPLDLCMGNENRRLVWRKQLVHFLILLRSRLHTA